MTVLSSRGRFVPVGGWPTAEAERLCEGWEGGGRDLAVLPCWRGLSLSFGFLRDWEASWAVRGVDGLAWLRCEEVRGGGMGAPAVVTAVAIWGVFRVVSFVDGAAGPLREGLDESGEAGCCW